jgi:hypothetical protein
LRRARSSAPARRRSTRCLASCLAWRSFEELARLCDPAGKVVKTDRISIISDALRAVTHLRAENNQLRQLNKFLEVGLGLGFLNKLTGCLVRPSRRPACARPPGRLTPCRAPRCSVIAR